MYNLIRCNSCRYNAVGRGTYSVCGRPGFKPWSGFMFFSFFFFFTAFDSLSYTLYIYVQFPSIVLLYFYIKNVRVIFLYWYEIFILYICLLHSLYKHDMNTIIKWRVVRSTAFGHLSVSNVSQIRLRGCTGWFWATVSVYIRLPIFT